VPIAELTDERRSSALRVALEADVVERAGCVAKRIAGDGSAVTAALPVESR
jgi:hypothetical protein